ncbi:hypothetical protein [Dyadobacter pollutisoli]|uniref:DUF2157 domain-containing protein n=1 Tax=Dyadobacter pollutisoli TaxID=2910158 RepID=A0A9E8NES5_9BACT|nr:hypothetical protein [Dyadobacter pollutisoli]WAC13641.1 hypothetical protein ON006_06720 [Dyadobacter pollutisoli]
MKKAYNENWIENLHIQQTASAWLSKNLLTKEQYEQVKALFPEQFYRPGIFVKIGLFFFATIACSFFVGFVSIFFIDSGSEIGFSFLSLICAVCFTVFLEYLIKNRGLFHSGVDNALLYAAVSAAMVPVFMLFENAGFWIYGIVALAILIPVILRYADLLATLIAFGVLFTLLADLMMKFPLGKALLPFSVMILSVVVYFMAKKNKSLYYQDCQKVLEVLSLFTFYLGGNYFVVREGNALMNDFSLPVSPQISFAPLFYFFTIIIPLAYIVTGLRKHDRILFIIGLLAFAFSIFTYRSYFSQLTPSQELAVAGALMIFIAWAAIRYLHTPKHELCDEPDGRRKLANLEAILVAQNLGQTPHENGIEFGGGNFGGGGAGEVY